MAEVFRSHLEWTGAAHGATRDVNSFSRDLEVSFESGIRVALSAAPAFKGDPSRLNPEQLFVASLSSCQALTYLALAAGSGVAVLAYSDDAEGRLALADGRLRLSLVTLRPRIVLDAGTNESLARDLIEKAHQQCFVANSVTSRVTIEPTFQIR
jgi:organic hydroperoxide reductase OsmC/OhrA